MIIASAAKASAVKAPVASVAATIASAAKASALIAPVASVAAIMASAAKASAVKAPVLIAAAVIAAGLFTYLSLGKVYKIPETPAGRVAVAGVGALGIAVLILVILKLLGRR